MGDRVSRRVGAVLLVVVPGLVGCLVNSRESTHSSGRYVSPSRLERIDPGRSTGDDVLSLLGEPSSRRENADGSETWRWTYRRTRTSSGHFLFGSSRRTETDGLVAVMLQDGVVADVWRDP